MSSDSSQSIVPVGQKEQKIVVSGRIPLGRELVLRQSLAPLETTKDGYQIKNRIGSKIDYRLAAANGPEQVEIRDKGLVTGFGIFGAPGTGKTHLMLHILKGMLDEVQQHPDQKFGGLILDPKAGLLEDVCKLWKSLGKHREGDLIVLKPDFLNYLAERKKGTSVPQAAPPIFQMLASLVGKGHPTALNVIDCALTPLELGRMLVLTAQSAGVAAKEPFWFLAWTNLFGAALTLLEYTEQDVPTIRRLLEAILLSDDSPNVMEVANIGKHGTSATKRKERYIEKLARLVQSNVRQYVKNAERLMLPEKQIENDLLAASSQIESFFQSDYVRTLEAFITNAFGSFQQFKFWCLSRSDRWVSQKYRPIPDPPSIYDRIMEEGKVVLVSIGPEDPAMGKILCTLVKCLFQQSVMSRLERFNAGKLKNFTRPVFIACDEYAEVASEIPGQPVGDGRFFSLSRQNGCMGLLATQSIHMLENSSLAESWKSIFSNLAAKIFMGAADNETAEQACNLAGQVDWEMNATTENFGKDNSFTHQRSFQQRPELTPYVLTHVLRQGQAVVLGSLDGRKTPPTLRFVEVPGSFQIRNAPDPRR